MFCPHQVATCVDPMTTSTGWSAVMIIGWLGLRFAMASGHLCQYEMAETLAMLVSLITVTGDRLAVPD